MKRFLVALLTVLTGVVSAPDSAMCQSADSAVNKPDPAKAPVQGSPAAAESGPVLTLADALSRASSRNHTILSAGQDLEKAGARLYQAWALLMPVVQGNVQWLHMNKEISVDFASGMPDEVSSAMGPSEPMVIQPQDQYTGALQATLPVINAASWVTIGVGKQGQELARIGLDEARRQIMFGVTQVYYGALMSRALVKLWEESIDIAARHLEAARARLEAGTGLRIDVARAELDYETAKQSLVTARLAYDNTRDALAVLVDMEKGALPDVQDAPDLNKPPDMESIVSKAPENRNDVRLAKAQVELASRSLDAVWMKFLPTLNLNWQLDHNFGEMPALGAQDRTTWTAVMVLSVPLFEGFRYGQLDENRASLKKSRIQLMEKQLNAEKEVRKSFRDFTASLANVETAKRQLELAREAMELADAAYQAGAGTSLDVMDAQKRHNDAGINLISQRLQSQLALITLYHYAGEDLLSLSREK